MDSKDIQSPSWWLLALELRAVLEAGAYALTFLPLAKTLKPFPRGENHPVLVLPGFLASDLSTVIMRDFIQDLGYDPFPWECGRNLADYEEIQKIISLRLKNIYQTSGGKPVTLIGWSLGGIYARELAKEHPEFVRQVITLSSPFKGITKDNNMVWIYDLIKGGKPLPPSLLESLKTPPPVPTTAIYSKSDGIVPWQYCVEDESIHRYIENIEVPSSHCGVVHNPFALACIANRLAQPLGLWKPFEEVKFETFKIQQ
ncbi:alpha/beta fold hydrolase [Eisenibacter elegans]|jgi:hypothetical protein|uniref:alpha/beta fold hydrolase n=1 Tax=Eisenibacter elegans TaxID=997 RepID=UPI000406917B|nr:alpha/beta fold hydrolase [Eisenibacter elegans]